MNPVMDVSAERLQELERIAHDYQRLQQLLEQAVRNENIERDGEMSVFYVDPQTHRIVDSNNTARTFLGYDTLIGKDIRTLETRLAQYDADTRTYTQSGITENVYTCQYQHADGYPLIVKVHQRSLPKNGQTLLHYRLEDQSLHHQFWRELQRRENTCFKFQEKLKTLNEIMIELSRIESFDALCENVIRLGMERLGFDRLSLWFVDRERQMMLGSCGVDERGEIRAEHGMQWSYHDTHVEDFLKGKTDATIAQDDDPIYNDRSEIIGQGWHLTAPLMHGRACVGILTADNYLRKQPIKNYEAELLRQYGLAVGQLTELLRTRKQAVVLQLVEEQNKMLHKFITDVGHDFRTPLSIISTKSFLIRRVDDTAQKSVLAQDIQQQVMAISAMLTNMSDYLQLTYGQEMNCEPVALRNFVQSVIDSYRDQDQNAQFCWQVTLSTDVMVNIDSYYMGQALGEIIENAIQYTLGKEGVKICFVQAYDEIGVQISDKGVGIDPKDLPHIFKPLYRADEARTERRSGLGLAVAKAIVEAHDGRITVESTVGAGSTFTVWLPILP